MKIKNRKTVYSTPWFQVTAKQVGKGRPYYSLKLPDYVTVVPMTSDGRFVIVTEYRPAIERASTEFPSGLVDAGESPAAAARRELLEETGFICKKLKPLGRLYPDVGRLQNRLWCFLAVGVKPSGLQPESGIKVRTVTKTELQRMIRKGSFAHALNLAALTLAVARADVLS